MKVQYTPSQKQVIDLRSCNLLVSAAAGSGKTAVLTQRIIERVCDGKNPVSIDRILIVTFTKAAAAEMRERIAAALHAKIKENPSDAHLKKQMMLLNHAQITTIDSFCLYLLRNHFHSIYLDPSFRIADENEMKLLKEDVLEELMDDYIREAKEIFISFTEQFTNGWNLTPAKERILQVYEFSQSHPFPADWLQSCRDEIANRSKESLYETEWMRFLETYECNVYQECVGLLGEALTICALPDGPAQYREALEEDLTFCRELAETKEYAKRSAMLGAYSFTRLSTKRNPDASEENKEGVKAIRENVKELLGEVQRILYFADETTIQSDYLVSGETLQFLLGTVLDFTMRLEQKKKEKNLIDFTDMEHKALQILLQKEGDDYVPSEVAVSYQEFFEEIMVDEYQDSNAVQELLLQSISRQSSEFGNRFMVGDVKQSIYRFRLAKPEIFMEKYRRFDKEKGVDRRIDLSMNFRSRKEVVDSVNAVFEKLMIKEVGGITYDGDARLYCGASYPPCGQDNKAEVWLYDRKKLRTAIREGILPRCDGTEFEARMIAGRIRELHGNFLVTDKETKELRPARYSDIVILLRVANGVDEVYKKILTQENIPTYITSRAGYFQTPEIHLLLDYLSLVNNPRQDIPLLSVLHSHIGGFREEEIASIRMAGNRDELLYDSVVRYAEKEVTDMSREERDKHALLIQKVRDFLAQLEHFRNESQCVGVYSLLEEILEELSYENHVSLLPGGEQRRANVRMLLQKAKSFETGTYSGLFQFVRYIESMKENAMDFGEANILSDDADVVRIMTIHKSKGLEFPICIVAGMSKQFRRTDYTDDILCDETYGVACNYFDQASRCKRTTIYKNAIGVKKKADARGEDIRILYVALTRAKEKLILSGAVNDMEKEASRVTFRQSDLLKAGSFMSLCMPLAMARTDVFEIRECLPEEVVSEHVQDHVQKLLKKELLQKTIPKKSFVSFEYPHTGMEGLYTKTTVSELKKAAYLESQESVAQLYPEQEETAYIPDFVSPKEVNGGARRGTAYHRVMELLRLAPLLPESERETDYDKQVKEMIRSGRIPAEEAQLVKKEKILKFCDTTLAVRLANAQREGTLRKEQPFVMGIPANLLQEAFPQEETVLIQGVIDAYFEEEGELVVLDYKTDRVDSAEELVRRYAAQLEHYAHALEKLTHKKVKEKLIYSFALDKVIAL